MKKLVKVLSQRIMITIIVMLILTGVTLSITLGDNGLVNKAKEATEATEIAMDRELLLSAVVGAIGNDGKVNLSAIVLPEGFTGSNGTYTSKNGNTFTVSENGEIKLGAEGGNEVKEVDLNGQYYWDGQESFLIMDNKTIVADGEEFPFSIDTETQSIIVKVETYDVDAGEVISYDFSLKYEFLTDGNNIINKFLIDSSEGITYVHYQNTEGFEHDLDGIYLNPEENRRFTFKPESGLVDYQYLSSDGNWYFDTVGEDWSYFNYKNFYYIDYQNISVSEDLTSLTYNGTTYTKQDTTN